MVFTEPYRCIVAVEYSRTSTGVRQMRHTEMSTEYVKVVWNVIYPLLGEFSGTFRKQTSNKQLSSTQPVQTTGQRLGTSGPFRLVPKNSETKRAPRDLARLSLTDKLRSR